MSEAETAVLRAESCEGCILNKARISRLESAWKAIATSTFSPLVSRELLARDAESDLKDPGTGQQSLGVVTTRYWFLVYSIYHNLAI